MPPEDRDDNDRQVPDGAKARVAALLSGVARAVPGISPSGEAGAGKSRIIALAVACTISIGAVLVAWFVIFSGSSADEQVTMDTVLETLDSGAYIEAHKLAKTLQEQGNLPSEELGGPLFAMGASACYEADATWSKRKTAHYLAASRYLEESRDRGFPVGRRAEGLFLLGKSYYMSGQIPASRAALKEALRVSKRYKTEIHRLLAEAYLNDAKPDLEKAMEQNTLHLADDGLPHQQRHKGLLQLAQIQFRLGKMDECVETLEKIPDKAKNRADAIIIRGQLLIEEARALKADRNADSEAQLTSRRKYQTAVKTLRVAQGHDTLSTNATRKAMYLIGVCFQETGDYRAALAQFARTRKLFPDSPEGLAANFQEAELCRQFGRDSAALAGYRRVLSRVTDPDNYSNPWLPLEPLRSRMLAAYTSYLGAENFEASLELTKAFYPLFSRVRTTELTARTYRTWGDSQLKKSGHNAGTAGETLRHTGRAHLRRAGQVYARLARMQSATRDYPDELWNSADAYMRGQDYTSAVKLLTEYLKNESRRRHGDALAMLGEARLSLGEVDEAIEAFKQCVEFHPRDPAAFRARLLASMAYVEKGDISKAESLLEENLSGEGMTPKSREWRDSLFALGELLYTDRSYGQAIRRLEEAVTRYPDAPQALEARFFAADSYFQSAKSAQGKLNSDIPQSVKTVHSKKIRELFAESLRQHQAIRQTLAERNELGELTPLEKSILRNCSFAIANIHFSTGRYEEAIKAYSTTTNRYQNSPEVLDAYVQIASAYRRLGKPDEAKATLEQAKAVLKRMGNTADFATTTNYNPQQWSQLLDWLGSL